MTEEEKKADEEEAEKFFVGLGMLFAFWIASYCFGFFSALGRITAEWSMS